MSSNMNKKVSVIVPCYNQGIYLGDCLDSVLSQTYQNWECIVVNDASADNTEAIALKYCSMDSRFTYIKLSENHGVSYSRNIAIDNSHGYYILPLDGDDKIASTYLEKAIRVFSEKPEIKLVYCVAMKFGRKNGIYQLPPYNYDDFIWGNQIFCSAFFKRNDFDKTNGFNVNMKEGLEDWDFWLSLLHREDIVYQIPEVLFYYRMKTDSRGHGSVKHMDELKIQIYHNHEEIYAPFVERIIEYHHQLLEKESLELENHYIKNSMAYKVGYCLSSPIRKMKQLFRR